MQTGISMHICFPCCITISLWRISKYKIFRLNRLPNYNCDWLKMPPRKVVSIHTLFNSFWKMPIFCLLCQRSRAEHPTPKCAALVYWLFWIKVTWKMADPRWTLWPSFLFLKVGDKTPMWKVSSLYQEKGRHSITRDEQSSQKKSVQTNLIKQTLIFLITSPQLTTPRRNPLVSSILYKFTGLPFIFFLSKRYKNFLLWSLFWVFILLWVFPCACKNE